MAEVHGGVAKVNEMAEVHSGLAEFNGMAKVHGGLAELNGMAEVHGGLAELSGRGRQIVEKVLRFRAQQTIESQNHRKNYITCFIRGETPAAAAWRSPATTEAMLNLRCNHQALQAKLLIQVVLQSSSQLDLSSMIFFNNWKKN